jgi:hypothetical protein
MDKEALKVALAEYGNEIRANGFAAGEPIIQKHQRKIRDFRRWAHAFGIMLRAEELLDQSKGSRP